MTPSEVYILAERTFNEVIQKIEDEQFGWTLPEWFPLGGSQDRGSPTLRTLVNYHAYDTAWIPDTFAGTPIDEVGSTYDGDVLGEDPRGSYRRYSERAVQAIVDDFDPARVVHFSYGDYPAAEAITHPTSFRIFRTYDIAKLVGQDRSLPEELCDEFWATVEPHVDMWRQMGVFQEPLPVPDWADPQARLFARAGRDPDWRR